MATKSEKVALNRSAEGRGMLGHPCKKATVCLVDGATTTSPLLSLPTLHGSTADTTPFSVVLGFTERVWLMGWDSACRCSKRPSLAWKIPIEGCGSCHCRRNTPTSVGTPTLRKVVEPSQKHPYGVGGCRYAWFAYSGHSDRRLLPIVNCCVGCSLCPTIKNSTLSQALP